METVIIIIFRFRARKEINKTKGGTPPTPPGALIKTKKTNILYGMWKKKKREPGSCYRHSGILRYYTVKRKTTKTSFIRFLAFGRVIRKKKKKEKKWRKITQRQRGRGRRSDASIFPSSGRRKIRRRLKRSRAVGELVRTVKPFRSSKKKLIRALIIRTHTRPRPVVRLSGPRGGVVLCTLTSGQRLPNPGPARHRPTDVLNNDLPRWCARVRSEYTEYAITSVIF